jgi:hypothetical protein
MVRLLLCQTAGWAAAPDRRGQDGNSAFGGGPSLQSLWQMSRGLMRSTHCGDAMLAETIGMR